MNIREVLETAIKMESDGVEFYSKAAKVIKEPSAKKVLEELAEWEKTHMVTFSKIRDDIIAKTNAIVDPDGEAMQYLRAFVKGAIFDTSASPMEYIKPDCSVEEILKIAIGLEKDAICCYTGIKMLFTDEFSKESIDKVIAEEIDHVRILSEQLNLVLTK